MESVERCTTSRVAPCCVPPCCLSHTSCLLPGLSDRYLSFSYTVASKQQPAWRSVQSSLLKTGEMRCRVDTWSDPGSSPGLHTLLDTVFPPSGLFVTWKGNNRAEIHVQKTSVIMGLKRPQPVNKHLPNSLPAQPASPQSSVSMAMFPVCLWTQLLE